MIDQTRKAVEETPVTTRVAQRRNREQDRERYKQLLQAYEDRSHDRERLQLEVMRLSGRVHLAEQLLHDIPRWRGRGRRAELTTQLTNDRQQLDTTRQHLQQLDQEVRTLKGRLDELRAQGSRREPREGRTLKLTNLPPRGDLKHLITNGPITHKPPAPAASPMRQTGYGAER